MRRSSCGSDTFDQETDYIERNRCGAYYEDSCNFGTTFCGDTFEHETDYIERNRCGAYYENSFNFGTTSCGNINYSKFRKRFFGCGGGCGIIDCGSSGCGTTYRPTRCGFHSC